MEKTLFENLCMVFKHYKGQFFKGFLLVAISNALLIFNPLILRQAVSILGNSGEVNWLGEMFVFGYGTGAESVWPWSLTLIGVAGMSALFKYWMRVTLITISRDVEKTVRLKIFERLQEQSMAFYDRHGVGELLSRLTNDISVYRDVLGPGVMYPLFFLTMMIPGLLALYSISKNLTIVACLPVMLIPVINLLVRNRIYQLSKKVQATLSKLSDQVQEHFSGIRVLKAFVVEDVMSNGFRKSLQKLVRLNFKLSCAQGLLWPFFTLITKMTTVALVFFFGVIALKAWHELSAADFVSFMWIQSYIFVPVLMLGWILPVYARGRAAYDRLVEIYNEPVEVQDHLKESHKIPTDAGIDLRNLSFSYPGSNVKVLKGITLQIDAGSFTGITGPIGSGKTTLFRLINRDYEIAKDMIFIGKKEIHQYPLESFYEQIVTVEQVPFLFSRTIAENVRVGRAEASQSEVEVVAKHADLHDTIVGFPDSYQTVVGERGVTLSGGQKQRLAIARAFLVNRSILLLDDIFAHVDFATEKRIFEAIKANFQGKTLLLITHRATILEKLDRVIYLKDGLVVEDGTPNELIKKKGLFSAIVELQKMGIRP